MKILLTGARGQLGRELASVLGATHEVVATDRSTLDLADAARITAVVRRVEPDLVVNAAAYTAVDRAESEPHLAGAVNAVGPGLLAAAAAEVGAAIIHYSTDYVFDGRARAPYRPDDVTRPLSVYGATKLEGEGRVLASDAVALVLRTSWVFSAFGRNFMTSMLRLATEREELRVVDDQHGRPTWARHLAAATARIVDHGPDDPPFGGARGVHHLAGSGGACTWYTFAAHIIRSAGIEPAPRLVPITTAEYPLPATRPAYGVLDCSSATDALGVTLPDWRHAVAEALVEMPGLRRAS
jgi:dTDP-4-dehydrorhamnose reductase